MELNKEKIDKLLERTDVQWYREMIRKSPFTKRIDLKKEDEMIVNAIKQAETFKERLLEQFGLKDKPMSYMISLDIPLDYVKEEASYGVQYLGYYSLKNKNITVNFTAVNLIIRNINKYKLDNVSQDKLRDTVIMHEMFHHLEELYPESYSNQKHLDTKIWGLFKSKINLSFVSEIAAVHFSKLMTDLEHSPLIYNEIYKLK